MSDAYKKAGVDIDAGEALVDAIKPLASATARPGGLATLGGFGAVFDPKAAGFADPLLVSGADGVGTKLKIAFETGVHHTIGIDLVAMCANDVLAQGAEPLFFLDYFATGKLDAGLAAQVIAGVAEGCKLAGCALAGGETAEMPGMYGAGEYDLAGFCVGAVERGQLLPRQVRAGDIMLGLHSSGAHSNGYSLIRKIAREAKVSFGDAAPFDDGQTLGEALLTPTRIYVKSVLPLLNNERVRAFAHITGGGLTDNVPRVFEAPLKARYDETALSLPPLFQWLKDAGALTLDEMRRTFNCGIGGVLIVAPDHADDAIGKLTAAGQTARVIGDIVED